jgi:formyltetrahydrofolate-dependent phosphoribosylglycinamide formyltransferase|tara:strand:- start:27 stop:677 length:651 start_codon:yes stop_codon:yes gene_type:complete
VVVLLNIGVLASTRASDLQAIIDAIEAKELNVKISVVVSDKKDAYALERAKKHGIEAVFIDAKAEDILAVKDKEERREAFDRKVAAELEKHDVELILAIGYMRIIGQWLVDKFRNKIINIHPSLLPAFAGGMDKDVHKDVLESGVKETGCTLFFIDETVDAGPVIFKKKVDVEENETVDTLKEKVQKAEQEVLIRAIKLYDGGKLKVENGKVEIVE